MKLLISVQLPGGSEVPVGVIEDITGRSRTGSATVAFSYASEYLSSPHAYPLAPALPLTPGQFTPSGTRSMLPGIADAQPDLWGRRLIDSDQRRLARSLGVAPTRATEVDVLAAVPDPTRQGALRFRVEAGGAFVSAVEPGRTPSLLDLDALTKAARAFDEGEDVSEEMQKLLAAGTSAGGARPKANVRRSDGSTALAKLPRDNDFGDAMAWEATALHLARDAGVTVPAYELVRIGDQSVLVLDRFDREEDGRRVGYISADSMLDKSPGELRTYVDLAEVVGRESAVRTDLTELFRRVAVTLLINNVDDHMRNHGFLRRGQGWAMSPAFDINPFYRHGSVESTPISDADDPARRDIRNLVEAADAFRLTRDEGISIILEAERATSRWREVGALYGLSPEGMNAMAHAFENPNRDLARELVDAIREPAQQSLSSRFPELRDVHLDHHRFHGGGESNRGSGEIEL